ALEHVIAKALSKSPLDRYASCGEFLAAARAAAAERRVHRRRLAVSLSLLALAALIGAVVALAVRAVAFGGESAAPTPAPPPPPRQATLAQLLLKSKDAGTLNDVTYTLMVAHEFARALPFAQRAVEKVQPGTVLEGYANYNLGYTLFRLGRCAEGVPYMEKAVPLEPALQRQYIRIRIKQAKRC